jgi:competence ComEA-like helix-hairpin-helix protein
MTTKIGSSQLVRAAGARTFAIVSWSLVVAAIAARAVLTGWSRLAASVRARSRAATTGWSSRAANGRARSRAVTTGWSSRAANGRARSRAVIPWCSRRVACVRTRARAAIASVRLMTAERALLVDRVRALHQRVAPFVAQWIAPAIALGLLVLSMGGTWRIAGASPPTAAEAAREASEQQPPVVKKPAGALTGKVNLNTATEEQLRLLPTVGPAKAERIVTWRKKNGGFKRIADLRRVKGFGYKTFKRLEPYLDIKGETTLQ